MNLTKVEDEKAEYILQFIPTGSENAVRRKNLSAITGLPDREVRRYIHFARRKIPIINLSLGRGYFIPNMNNAKDQKLLIRFVLQEESRLKAIGWALFAARRTLQNCNIDWRKTA